MILTFRVFVPTEQPVAGRADGFSSVRKQAGTPARQGDQLAFELAMCDLVHVEQKGGGSKRRHLPEGMSMLSGLPLGGEGRSPMFFFRPHSGELLCAAKYSEYTFFARPLTLLRKAAHAGKFRHSAYS